MECKRFAFLFVLILGLVSSQISMASRTTMSRRSMIEGGFQPIGNLSNPYIVMVAQFAVAEHNKQASDNLVFLGLLDGEEQEVEGINFKLVIVTLNSQGSSEDCSLEVYVKPMENEMTLISFNRLPKGVKH